MQAPCVMLLVPHKYIGDSKMFEYDRYYRECQHSGRPFIRAKVSPVHGRYHVQMDMVPCGRRLSLREQDAIQEMFEAEADFVRSRPGTSEGFSIDPELVWFDGVSPEHLDALCCRLHDMVQGGTGQGQPE